MLFNLLGVVFAGVAAAGVVHLVFRMLRRRPPSWLMPAAAGFAMFGFHLWNEYTWFDRVARGLPDEIAVVESYDYANAIQPWTLLRPRIDRFTAVDRASIRRNDRAPGYVMADLLLVRRLDPTARVTQLVDCRDGRRTDIGRSTAVDERGLPIDATWTEAARDGGVFRLLCDGMSTSPSGAE